MSGYECMWIILCYNCNFHRVLFQTCCRSEEARQEKEDTAPQQCFERLVSNSISVMYIFKFMWKTEKKVETTSIRRHDSPPPPHTLLFWQKMLSEMLFSPTLQNNSNWDLSWQFEESYTFLCGTVWPLNCFTLNKSTFNPYYLVSYKITKYIDCDVLWYRMQQRQNHSPIVWNSGHKQTKSWSFCFE